MLDNKESQIKSKKRVADHGEVFTNEREVKAMCDLVDNETQRIDSRFLEPACGDGNFLAEILNRKINIPGVLIEVGFLSNTNERYLLRKKWYQKKIVKNIKEVLIDYYN